MSDRQFPADASRKRKSMDVDLGYDEFSSGFSGNLESRMGGHSRLGEYTMQQNVALPPEEDSRFKLPEMFSYFSSDRYKPSNTESQYGTSQFYNMDNSLVRSVTKDENINKNSLDSLIHFNYNEPTFQTSNHIVCSSADQYELSKFPSHDRINGGIMGMSQAANLRSEDGSKLGHEHYSNLYNPCLNPFNMPSNNNITILNSTCSGATNGNFYSYGGNVSQKFITSKVSEETKSNHDTTGLEECRIIPIGEGYTTQAIAFSEGRKPNDVYQYPFIEKSAEISNDNFADNLNLREQSGPTTSRMPVLKESSSSRKTCLDHVVLENSTHVSKDSEANLLEKTEGSNLEESLPKHASTSSSRRVGVDNGVSLNLEDYTQLHAGKASPLITERLWDGSIQLNTSTTVSAVAFFKSGEKAPNIKWSEHIEVKGKVRLQAFEKYIQELPRSRNRALMVISLCEKVGSSEPGLSGMKEVSKGYRESEKVGFAQIYEGLDLYVCPRSDTIITILAKYGFFKGMAAAVEDEQDSLIGCVIWRRGGQTPSLNKVPNKISEKKKTTSLLQEEQQPQKNSPSVVLEINSPVIQVGDEPVSKQEKVTSSLISTSSFDSTMMAENIAVEQSTQYNCTSSNDTVGNFHVNSTVPQVTASVPPYSCSPHVPVQKLGPTTSTSLQVQEETSMKHTPVITPITQTAEPKKNDGSGGTENLVQPILIGPPPHNIQKQQKITNPPSNIFGSYNSSNYTFCPPPQLIRASVPLDSPFFTGQQPIRHIVNSRFGPPIPMQKSNDSKGELAAEPATSAPPPPLPPLPPNILQRNNQFSNDAPPYKGQVPPRETPKVDTSFMLTEAQQKKRHVGSEAEQSVNIINDDDDDGDLPEFDFDSACAIAKVLPTSESPWSSHHQTHTNVAASLNRRFPINIDVIKNESEPTMLHPVVTNSMDFGQVRSSEETVSKLSARRCEVINSEKKHAAANNAHQALPRLMPLKEAISKDSLSSSNISHKTRWDDDDDMPEWCPPDLNHVVDVKLSKQVCPPSIPIHRPESEITSNNQHLIPTSSSMTTFRSFPSISHGYSCYPGILRPPLHDTNVHLALPAQTRPPQDSKLPLRFPAPDFGTKSPTSDVKWQQWKNP